jgi:hypothetical protein
MLRLGKQPLIQLLITNLQASLLASHHLPSKSNAEPRPQPAPSQLAPATRLLKTLPNFLGARGNLPSENAAQQKAMMNALVLL